MNALPAHSARAALRSRVIPGRSWTTARRVPSTRLKNVDLPTFGRPMMATTGRLMRLAEGLQTTRRAPPEGRTGAPRVAVNNGAGNGVRTRDLKLGKLALYQLSYARVRANSRRAAR